MGALDTTFGMIFNGLVISSSLFGVNVLQSYIYFRTYDRDPLLTKAMVGVIILLDAAGTLFLARGTYAYLVTGWGNPSSLESLNYGIFVSAYHVAGELYLQTNENRLTLSLQSSTFLLFSGW
ncbi:hypothetical protein BT96DRAFT_555395 [Gymnopus androsaceus JB14]|uniref:Uncharacterized protein n=1 Tax=Gymnopus androsaceus JB14 TaxID=1447944 RepID=A0A6A4GK29_9AGAR|nr:hypothetical protein BT96DRAFT_555395 [Gymnopus androsaceus JB14]